MHEVMALDLVGSGLTYAEIWDLQKFYLEEIRFRRLPEMILFCEHENVVTAGRRARKENLLSSRLPLYEIERGGDFTLHQPGQLVIYPLTRVQERWQGLRGLLKGLEIFTAHILEKRGLRHRVGPATGVWVGDASPRKIASIGVAVRHWISYHGISINIANDLSLFGVIRPCDFEASIMTSLQKEGVSASLSEVISDFIEVWNHFFTERVTLQSWQHGSDFLRENTKGHLLKSAERY